MSEDATGIQDAATNLGNLVSPIGETGMEVEATEVQADEDDEEFGPDVSRDRWTRRIDEAEEESMDDEERRHLGVLEMGGSVCALGKSWVKDKIGCFLDKDGTGFSAVAPGYCVRTQELMRDTRGAFP